MKCNTVRTNLAGYLDDAITGGARVAERVQIRQHLEACNVCREELERFRKLAVMLLRVPKNIPPADSEIGRGEVFGGTRKHNSQRVKAFQFLAAKVAHFEVLPKLT